LLSSVAIWQEYSYVTRIMPSASVRRTYEAALAGSRAGFNLFSSDPSRAHEHFRKAIPLWEKLVEDAPGEPEHRISLAIAHLNLGSLLLKRNSLDEPQEHFTRCAEQIERLKAGPLPHSERLSADQIRRSLLSAELSLNTELGTFYRMAGDGLRAENAYHRVLEILKEAPEGASLAPDLGTSRNRYESAARNGLAWLSAVSPGRSQKQIREAVVHAERAIELDRNNRNAWNTLALARYRAEDWPAASTAIEHSMRLSRGGDVYDWVILAMIRWRQHNQAESRQWYGRATAVVEKQKSADGDLRRLYDETTTLISVSPTVP
jgi:tetratricopeptide (TPR) repeat protein